MRRIVAAACLFAASLAGTAQQPARPAITGIAFARFYTTNPSAAQQFYSTTLGYQRKEAGGTWIYPVNRSQWIELLTTAPPPQPNVRMAAVGFTTRDAKALEQYLQAKGIKPELPLSNGRFAVRDPESNLVFFVQTAAEKAVSTAAPSPAATSTRIIHVGFIVHNSDSENAFWQDILGFRPLWHGGHTDDVTDWISLQVPEGTDWLEYMLNPARRPHPQAGRRLRPLLARHRPHAGRRRRPSPAITAKAPTAPKPSSAATARSSSTSSTPISPGWSSWSSRRSMSPAAPPLPAPTPRPRRTNRPCPPAAHSFSSQPPPPWHPFSPAVSGRTFPA